MGVLAAELEIILVVREELVSAVVSDTVSRVDSMVLSLVVDVVSPGGHPVVK